MGSGALPSRPNKEGLTPKDSMWWVWDGQGSGGPLPCCGQEKCATHPIKSGLPRPHRAQTKRILIVRRALLDEAFMGHSLVHHKPVVTKSHFLKDAFTRRIGTMNDGHNPMNIEGMKAVSDSPPWRPLNPSLFHWFRIMCKPSSTSPSS